MMKRPLSEPSKLGVVRDRPDKRGLNAQEWSPLEDRERFGMVSPGACHQHVDCGVSLRKCMDLVYRVYIYGISKSDIWFFPFPYTVLARWVWTRFSPTINFGTGQPLDIDAAINYYWTRYWTT